MPLRLHYCDHYELPLPEGHRFPIEKYRLLRRRLSQDQRFTFSPARLATREAIEIAHDPAYVSSFLEGTLDGQAMRRIGFPWSEHLVQRTLGSVGGTIAAARDALDRGFGGTLAGGTHHAFHAAGSGYCVFNDIAVALRGLLAARRISRAAVIDLDVHQGDGTAALFEDEPAVLTISLHGANNFPFRKRQSKIDLALPDGARDETFLETLGGVLPRLTGFSPDLVVFQSGVDTLAEDRLGRLSLTQAGLRERDRMVLGTCLEHGIPVAVTLGGAMPIRSN